jgi:hypothetical protein
MAAGYLAHIPHHHIPCPYPPRLTRVLVACVREKVAVTRLKEHKWNLEQAVEDFFESGGASAVQASGGSGSSRASQNARLDALFAQFRGADSVVLELDTTCARRLSAHSKEPTVTNFAFRNTEKDEDIIGVDGTERFCEALSVDPTDVVM